MWNRFLHDLDTQNPLCRHASQKKTTDGQVTISIPLARVPVLFHARQYPNKPWGRPSYPASEGFR